MKTSRGFTIIELLVVIAIIAVLAAVVMVNVTSYINKGKDAAMKANMATITTAAAAFYDTNSNSTYTGLGSDSSYAAAVAAIESANGASNNVTDEIIAGAYCVETPLLGGGEWCVDSTGYVGATAVCDATTADCAAD
jgi:prepilin-type N-terminal cleavage/methylation domain-containing protein